MVVSSGLLIQKSDSISETLNRAQVEKVEEDSNKNKNKKDSQEEH